MSETPIRGPRVEANKATVRHMLQRLSAGEVAGFTDHLSPNYVRHSQAMPSELQEIRGRDAMHQWLLSNLVPFPDYQEELEWLVGEGDFVAWRSRGRGTQSGPFGPFPATGKRMDLVIIGMHRFEGPLVAETWTSWDNLAVLTQLGHFPPGNHKGVGTSAAERPTSDPASALAAERAPTLPSRRNKRSSFQERLSVPLPASSWHGIGI